MARIKLTQGKYTNVDEKDYDSLSRFNWCVNSSGYAVARMPGGHGKQLVMHRLILETPSMEFVDHINRNRLDNRRSNLRVCSRTENARNKGAQKNSQSHIKGVSWDKNRNKWRVQITAGSTSVSKRFSNLEDASQYYKHVARVYHGDFAVLN